jgi:putative transposase
MLNFHSSDQDFEYHVFNRSNNSQVIFPNKDKYLFFLTKINEFIKPHAQILAWCLMPTHFHLMIDVDNCQIQLLNEPIKETLQNNLTAKYRTLNDSVAIMLRSYTRTINLKYKRHGSLFQQHTKALCLTEPQFAPAYFQTQFGTIGNISMPEKEYPNVCFNYIHMNPVNDRLVKSPEDWEFSSYRDYFCGRNGKLVNKELAKEIGLFEE